MNNQKNFEKPKTMDVVNSSQTYKDIKTQGVLSVQESKEHWSNKHEAVASQSDTKNSPKPEKNEIQRMDQFIIKFKCPDNLDPKEMTRQLNGQQRGINSMDISHWQGNRENFKINGRSLEGNEAQNIQREKALQSRIKTNQDKGMSYSDAKKEADNWIKTQAALHNPDQIAGGDPNKVSRMGDSRVNSSIGRQWQDRINSLESAVKEYAKGKSPEELAKIKMNVKLEMER